MKFFCYDCEVEVESDWVASDDWPDGVLRGVGLDCPKCDCEMEPLDKELEDYVRGIEEMETPHVPSIRELAKKYNLPAPDHGQDEIDRITGKRMTDE